MEEKTQTLAQKLRELTADTKPYWGSLLKSEDYFTAKFATEFNNERVVGMFESELKKGDIYMELFDFNGNFVESERILYKLSYRPGWKDRYPEMVKGNTTFYNVPIDELEVINRTPFAMKQPLLKTAVKSTKEMLEETPGSASDENYTMMTIRDYYCITHQVPHSNKPWLNELIRSGRAYTQK